jgi:hypothetical protein
MTSSRLRTAACSFCHPNPSGPSSWLSKLLPGLLLALPLVLAHGKWLLPLLLRLLLLLL